MFLSIPCSYLKHFMMANVLKPNKSGENCIRTPHCPSLAMINCWVALFICFPSSLYSSLNFVLFFGMQDLSSPTRDHTHTLSIGKVEF